MLFSDPEFLFFFLPVVLALNFLLPARLRNLLLLLASLVFYALGEGVYIGVLLVSILFNFAAARAIEQATSQRKRDAWLWIAVVGDLLMLVRFKYFAFIVSNIVWLFPWLGLKELNPATQHLPVGISFFTFQAISYVVDVYRRQIPAIRSVLDFGMYKSLFPQLIAGPIVRAKTIYTELHERSAGAKDIADGARRFAAGLAKKVVIADTMATAADSAFNASRHELTTSLAWIGLICYALQIYYDFSGYSDMAIGIGRMLGFHFFENFRYPYSSRSVTEFWRRWHISLSTWFRDYVYIPLGGNRHGRWRVYLNLAIVFLLCGLWHGANWTFVIWGAWHGAFLIIERTGALNRLTRRRWPIANLYLLFAVLLGWVWFRAASVPEALHYFKSLAGFGASLPPVRVYFGADIWIVMAVGIIFSWPAARWCGAAWRRYARRADGSFHPGLYLLGRLGQAGAMAMNLSLALLQAAEGTHNPFIYFRF